MSIYDAAKEPQYANSNQETFSVYTPDKQGRTGEFKSAVRVAYDEPGTYALKFELTDSETGKPVKLPLFPLNFYDIDGDGESVKACGVADVIGANTSLRETFADGCYTHSAQGREVNLPKDLNHLTPNQKKQSITYVYKDTSEWYIEFSLTAKNEGRTMVFKSTKVLACDDGKGGGQTWIFTPSADGVGVPGNGKKGGRDK